MNLEREIQQVKVSKRARARFDKNSYSIVVLFLREKKTQAEFFLPFSAINLKFRIKI